MKGYEDLLKLVKRTQVTGGLDINEESIVEYQDMIGHSTIEQLQELSNSEFKETFYRVYGHSYGTVEAIKFYCKNSEWMLSRLEEIDNLTEENNSLSVAFKEQVEMFKHQIELTEKAQRERDHNAALIAEQKERIDAQEREIITLKAKLYDMMMK